MLTNSFRRYSAWLLLLIPVIFLFWYFRASKENKPVRMLPVYGPRHDSLKSEHRVPAFAFTDQDGKKFTEKNLEGRIYVSEFFFTTCQSICPVMNDHLGELYLEFKDEPRLHFVSHTVDPETDDVSRLKAYAENHGVHDDRWHFLTGEKKELYHMARKGYLLDSGSPVSHEDDFVHTQNFALVDWEKKLRGFYDGTDSLEMVRLRQDIRILLDEQAYNENSGA